MLIGFAACEAAAGLGPAPQHWSDLNIGPFYVDFDGDTAAAREALTQLEQVSVQGRD